MKKIGLIFFLFAAGVGFSSCSDDDPTQLSFEDVYGRPGWDTGVNANYFTFDETKQNNVELTDLTEEESDRGGCLLLYEQGFGCDEGTGADVRVQGFGNDYPERSVGSEQQRFLHGFARSGCF